MTFPPVHLLQNTENLDKALYNNGSNGGDYDYTENKRNNRLQGIEISNDGTKLFLIWMMLLMLM